MNTKTKPAARAVVSQSGRTIAALPSSRPADKPAAPAEKTAVSGNPKAGLPSKTRKTAGRPLRLSRAASSAEKLVCRYCSSDDLAPSFKKRCDARCRACFKQRYGSAARGKKVVRTRKTKSASSFAAGYLIAFGPGSPKRGAGPVASG